MVCAERKLDEKGGVLDEIIAGLICGLVALAGLNLYASRRCWRDELSSRGQRLAQIAFVWLLPGLGAAVALHLLRAEPERSSGTYLPEKDVGAEYVTGFGRPNANGYISSPDDNFHSGSGDAPSNY